MNSQDLPRENPQGTKVVLAVNGVFHHFELAHELKRRGLLKAVYSSYPWRRLKREALERQYVRSFPWLHTIQMGVPRMATMLPALDHRLSHWVPTTLDRYVARTLPACDVLVALSGSGLASGKVAQQRGALYLCDRGSSHIRYQDQILAEEYRIWGQTPQVIDPFFIAREEAEYAQADAITVPSSFALRSFIEMGVPEKKLHLISLGVRLDRFKPTETAATDSFNVLFAGTVTLRKGVPYLLEAFRALKHPRKRLRLVGPLLPEVESLLARFDMTGVEVIGRVPQTQMSEYMSHSHVMVLPSIEDGFGMVMGQAMACGCPVIASTNTGGEDLFTDGVEGFIVPIRSPQAITERLQQLADDPALQQQMSEAALACVKHLGGWTQYGDQWESLLQILMDRKSY